ncbi:hypothetical protein [Hungatella sp. SB206]
MNSGADIRKPDNDAWKYQAAVKKVQGPVSHELVFLFQEQCIFPEALD